MIIVKILKLIPKIIIAPVYLVLGLIYVLGNGSAALSSVVTNLVGSFFIAGAAAGWLAHGDERMIWTVAGTGIFLLLAPLILKGLLGIILKLSGLLSVIWAW